MALGLHDAAMPEAILKKVSLTERALLRLRPWSLIAMLWLCLSPAASAQPDAVTDRIRGFLEALDAGDVPVIAGARLNEPDALARVYRSRDHAPMWLAGGSLAGEIPGLLVAISESVAHGFAAERYHRSRIDQLLIARDRASELALELLLTDAFLAQALHRGRGAVNPPNLDAEWRLPVVETDAAALLIATAGTGSPVAEVLASLWPTSDEYAALVERRVEIAASGDRMTAQVAPGPPLKPGQSSDRVIMLKTRLMGPGEYTPLYDEALRDEVVAFQRSAGLEPDGIVGDHTLEVLNATRVSWIDKIDANLERWRWLPRETPETYVRVNIAAFNLRVIEDGRAALSMNVIVGRPYRRTPVFTEVIRYMVLNPYWDVPFSIATKDKLPQLKTNAAAEAANGFEAKPHGSDAFIPVDAIDWHAVTRQNFNYQLRQRPGQQNALGAVKFMLPNPYAVYLHDTPSKELFTRQERTFSSGCVRLERPFELARWLLAREGHPSADRIEALVKSGQTQTIHLKKPVPIYIVYLTAFLSDEGEVSFRRDVYGRDGRLLQALRRSEP